MSFLNNSSRLTIFNQNKLFLSFLFILYGLFISNLAFAICDNPIFKYNPASCPVGYEHMPTNNCQCNPGCCVITCAAQCLPLEDIEPVPISCEEPACEGVSGELIGLCPLGQEVAGESCSCTIYKGICSKQCTPICENPNYNPYADIPPEPEPGLIPGPQVMNDPDVPVQGRLGSHDVTAQGQFTYTVPIAVPPGTNGMQPGIALTYSSASSNGPVGVGWNIAGVSAIARCPKNYEIDDERGGITFTYEDRFCLDGQRLILIDGEYGKADSRYRLENDNMTEIIVHEGLGQGPSYFQVKYPNGAISYYGLDSNDAGINSRHLVLTKNGFTARTWALSYVQDRFLNYQRYIYLSEDTGEILLHKVFYSGHKLSSEDNNQADTIDPYNRVELIYENREDTQTFYLAGAKIKQNQLLKRIEVYERNELVWNYKLEYETPDHFHHPQLVNIQQCFGVESYCAPKTSFNWNNENFNGITYDKNNAADWLDLIPSGPDYYCEDGSPYCDCIYEDYYDEPLPEPICTLSLGNDNSALAMSRIKSGDFDGNGLTDFYVLLPYYTEELNYGWDGHDRIYLTVFDEESQSYEYKTVKGLSYAKRPINLLKNEESVRRFRFQDINGDGKTDLYLIRGGDEPPNGMYDVKGNTHDLIFLFDIPVNGVDGNNNDIEYAQYTEQWGIPSVIGEDLPTYDMDRIKFGDFNGDGNADISYTTGEPHNMGIMYVCYYREFVGYMHPQDNFNVCNDEIWAYSGDIQDLIDDDYDAMTGRRDAKQVIDVIGDVVRYVGMAASYAGMVAALAAPGGQAVAIISIISAANSTLGAINNFAGVIVGSGMVNSASHDGGTSDYTRIADFNGDGMSDVLVIEGNNIGFDKIYFSQGEDFIETDVTSVDFGHFNRANRYQVGDFNGDGLADIYFFRGGEYVSNNQTNGGSELSDKLYLSKGDGSFIELNDPLPGKLGWEAYEYYVDDFAFHKYLRKLGGYRLMDFNGDGRTDLYEMFEPHDLSEQEIQNGQDTIYHWYGKDHDYTTVKQQFRTSLSPYNITTILKYDMNRIRYGDFNGDGMIDIYEINHAFESSDEGKIIFNRNTRPLIVSVEHERDLGGEVLVEYSRLSDPGVYDPETGPDLDGISSIQYRTLKGSMNVVKEAKVSNGQGSYLGNRYFYRYGLVDKQGRGFLGFRQVINESFSEGSNQSLIRTTTRYKQEYPFTGLVERQKVERLVNADNNNEVVISYTENKWKEVGGLNIGKRFSVYLEENTSTNYDPDNGKPLSRTINKTLDIWDVNYDSSYWFPKQSKIYTYGFDGENNPVLLSRALVEKEYQHFVSDWVIGLVKDEYTFVDTNDTKGGVDEKWHHSNYLYSSDDVISLEEAQHYYKKDNVITSYLTQHYYKDTFGNPTADKLYGEEVPEQIFRRSLSVNYTENGVTNGRYADVSSNVYGHQSSVMYRKGAFGIPLQMQDENGRIYARALTKDGKVKQSWNEEGSWERQSVMFCEEMTNGCYSPSAIFATYSKSSVVNPDTHTMVEYDALGRVIDSTVYLSDALNDDDIGVSTRVIYDEYGRVVRESGPKFGHLVAANDNTVDWQEYEYDDLGRLLEQTLLGKDNQAIISYQYGTAIDPVLNQRLTWTRVIDPNGYQKESYSNVLGQIVKIIDFEKKQVNENEYEQIPIEIRYEYDVLGNMTKLLPETGESYAVIAEYDGLGRMFSRTDPSLGTWTYEYNGFGEIKSQTDAKQQTTYTRYDRLGRIEKIVDLDGASVWVYDESELGALTRVERTYSPSSIVQNYSREYHYDPMSGRVESMIHKVDGVPYVFDYTYDSKKRPYTMTYPGGFGVILRYSDWGFVNKVDHLGGSETFWAIDEEYNDALVETHLGVDAYFRPLAERMGYFELEERLLRREMSYYDGEKGNGLKTTKSWMGWIENETKEPLQNHFYDYDQLGNLAERRNDLLGLQEVYEYDGLYRLKKVYGEDLYSYIYDKLGNIKGKSPFGSMGYGDTQHPYQVTQRGNKTFNYDANGNMTQVLDIGGPFPDREIEWTSFNKPLALRNTDVSEAWFAYDAEGNRLFQEYQGQTKYETHLYLGSYEEANVNGEWKQIYYIPGGAGETIAQRVVFNGQDERVEYILSDHLGSPDKVVRHENGGWNMDSYDFSPFGDRREEDWQMTLSYLGGGSEKLNRSFTSHIPFDGEQEELIDMNARFYDPHLGRFISPDTILPNPYSTQDLNPYAYVRNNPGSLTDPTGHCPPPCILLDTVVVTASANAYKDVRVINNAARVESRNLQIEGLKEHPLMKGSATKETLPGRNKISNQIGELKNANARQTSKTLKFSKIVPVLDIGALIFDAHYTFSYKYQPYPGMLDPGDRMSRENFWFNCTMTIVAYCGPGKFVAAGYFISDAIFDFWPNYSEQMQYQETKTATTIKNLQQRVRPMTYEWKW